MSRRDEIIQRIMSNVNVVDGCWLWKGATSGKPNRGRNGRGHSYPRMKLGGVTVAVHRVTATHKHGYIPSNKTVDHLCRNRLCVNPDHLEVVSHFENCKRRDKC